MVLNGWKEIAQYLGRAPTTVQRWETKYGLPIHRPAAKSRTPVCASKEELDRWLLSAPTDQVHHEAAEILEARLKRLKEEVARIEKLLASKAQPTEIAKLRAAFLLLPTIGEALLFSSAIADMSLQISNSL